MSSWKEQITLKLYPNCKICLWTNKENNVNNLILPIKLIIIIIVGFK